MPRVYHGGHVAQRGTTDLCKVVLFIAGERTRLRPPPLLLQRLARRCRAGDVRPWAIALLRLRHSNQQAAHAPLSHSSPWARITDGMPDATHLPLPHSCSGCSPIHFPRARSCQGFNNPQPALASCSAAPERRTAHSNNLEDCRPAFKTLYPSHLVVFSRAPGRCPYSPPPPAKP